MTFDIGLLLIISRSLVSIHQIDNYIKNSSRFDGTPDKESASYYSHIFDAFGLALNLYRFNDASKFT